MRSIQEVGMEILGGSPSKFYIFCGSEYGIKCKYIQLLKEHYHGNYECYDHVQDVLNMMKVRRIIPLVPSLYVVRYDDQFISALSQSVSDSIKHSKIVGTLVCIYESEKQLPKIDKYLGDYAVVIDSVSPQYVRKYLHQEFSGIPDTYVDIAIQCSSDYNQARGRCAAMKSLKSRELIQLSNEDLMKVFGYQEQSSESMLKMGIAARNFNYCMSVLDSFSEYDSIYYIILQTLLELDKIKSTKYAQSDLHKYSKLWTPNDIYHMFDHTYNELKQSRSMSTNIESSVIYLLSLINLSPIPSREVLSCD